ncbi:MAG: fused ferrous iron transport protein A/B [Elusimicrobia bacterium]|nr:fused ferrous iron transport protein A/B [Elusimicrobiota bacterium]
MDDLHGAHIIKTLSQLKNSDVCVVSKIKTDDAKTIKKLSSLGFVAGAFIRVKKAGNPVILEVAGTDVALGKNMAALIEVKFEVKKIVLVGNPNVGKSAVFSRLTGVKAVSSNFPGTTVELKQSVSKIGDRNFVVYDVPGVYSLQENSAADKAALEVIKSKDYDLIVCVLDAMHLERSLFMALEMMSLNKPIILLVNKTQTAKTNGIAVDAKMLHRTLGIPAVAVEALTGEGFKKAERVINRMVHFVKLFIPREIPQTDEEKWKLIGEISKTAQVLKHKHPSPLERLAELCTRPLTGLPIAVIVLISCFFIIMRAGEGIISLLTPVYEYFYLPAVTKIFEGHGIISTILLGGGTVNAFGILTDALRISLIDVMSYVIVFYAVLEFLADLGYLPRLSVLLDSMLHKIGIHGYGAIPIMMGLGCKVPAVMGVRTLESKREKIIATVLLLIIAPCISQSAMIISVLSPHGLKYILMVFGTLLLTGIAAGYVLNKIMKGNPPEMFMEIPAWQVPKLKEWLSKVRFRIKEYLKEAVPVIIAGVLIINLAQITGALDFITRVFRPFMVSLFGLPGETASVMLLGFLRKDVSVALLVPFNLTAPQLVTACIFMTMYAPCAATCFIMFKETGVKDSLKIIALTFILATAIAFSAHIIFSI